MGLLDPVDRDFGRPQHRGRGDHKPTPRSLADLGWQAEALWLADDELQAGGAEYHLILPLIENMRAFAR